MDVRKLVLLIGALAVAAVTAIMAKNMFSGAGAPQASAKAAVKKGPEVLVATRALPVGTIIDAEALKYQAWPEGLVQPAYFVKGEKGVNPADLIGTVVRNEITAGQPISQGALIKPGDRGFLAAALGPGMRAITVSVSDTSSVAGFVFPGDRVDLMLTQSVGGGEGEALKVSETILRNVRVLATDRRTTSVNQEGKAVVKSVSLVTLEVTPKIAEKIAVAQTIGNLSLTLRSIADNTMELEQAIASGDIDVPEGEDPVAERRMLLAIANKPNDNGTTYTVGSEVSRFERSSLPARKQPSAEPMDAMGRMMSSIVSLAAGKTPAAPAEAQPPRPTGPVVRIARGNNVTVVPVGAK